MKIKQNGFGVLEVIVGVAIISVALFSFNQAAISLVDFTAATGRLQQAGFLLGEGIEALRSIRDRGWTANIASLAEDVSYFLLLDENRWKVAGLEEIIDGRFYRSFVMEEVSRDSNKDISASGFPDSDTKRFIVTVSWSNGRGATSTKTAAAYLTNYFND